MQKPKPKAPARARKVAGDPALAARPAEPPEVVPAAARRGQRTKSTMVVIAPLRAGGGSDLETKTMGEDVYARLRSDLIAGRITPGAKLPFRQLSARYGVGIGPLREALVRLSSEQMVAFEGQRGFMAAPLSMDDLNDLCSLRIDLSCRALRESIAKGGEDWEDEILVALHRLERSPLPVAFDDDIAIDEWERRHDRFHTSLIGASGSRWLLHFCATLSDQFQRYRRFTVLRMSQSYSVFDEVRSQHRTMAEAVLERRTEDAVALLTTHYESSLARVTEQMEIFVNRKRA